MSARSKAFHRRVRWRRFLGGSVEGNGTVWGLDSNRECGLYRRFGRRSQALGGEAPGSPMARSQSVIKHPAEGAGARPWGKGVIEGPAAPGSQASFDGLPGCWGAVTQTGWGAVAPGLGKRTTSGNLRPQVDPGGPRQLRRTTLGRGEFHAQFEHPRRWITGDGGPFRGAALTGGNSPSRGLRARGGRVGRLARFHPSVPVIRFSRLIRASVRNRAGANPRRLLSG